MPSAPARSTATPLPLAGDFPELSSKDCVEVVRFYVEAISAHDFDKAALVWNDPVIDAARLRALFAGYREPLFEWTEPFVDGGGGSLLLHGRRHADRRARSAASGSAQGTLELRRVGDSRRRDPGRSCAGRCARALSSRRCAVPKGRDARLHARAPASASHQDW